MLDLYPLTVFKHYAVSFAQSEYRWLLHLVHQYLQNEACSQKGITGKDDKSSWASKVWCMYTVLSLNDFQVLKNLRQVDSSQVHDCKTWTLTSCCLVHTSNTCRLPWALPLQELRSTVDMLILSTSNPRTGRSRLGSVVAMETPFAITVLHVDSSSSKRPNSGV